jgi:hypothetical protein
VLLGIGGSSLAPEVFRRSFEEADGLTLHVLDSTHPDQVRAVLDAVDLDKAIMIVSSKSGGTVEPNSMFKAFHARQPDGGHYVAVTDPGTSLEKLAHEHSFRRVFHGDPEIGGRYSALSPFGIVPAVLGADVRLLSGPDGARAADPRSHRRRWRCGSASRWESWRSAAATNSRSDRRAAQLDRAVDRAACRREHRQARQGDRPGSPTSRRDPSEYGEDRVFLQLQNARGEGDARRSSRLDAPPTRATP